MSTQSGESDIITTAEVCQEYAGTERFVTRIHHEMKKEDMGLFEKPEIPAFARAFAVWNRADAVYAVFCYPRL